MDDLALAKSARLFLCRPVSAHEVPLSTTARAVRCAKRRSRPSRIQSDHSTANVSALACPPFCQQAFGPFAPSVPPEVDCTLVDRCCAAKEDPTGRRRVSPYSVTRTGSWGIGGLGVRGPRPHSINKLIKLRPTTGSGRSTATGAMLTCGKFRNEKCAASLTKWLA